MVQNRKIRNTPYFVMQFADFYGPVCPKKLANGFSANWAMFIFSVVRSSESYLYLNRIHFNVKSGHGNYRSLKHSQSKIQPCQSFD